MQPQSNSARNAPMAPLGAYLSQPMDELARQRDRNSLPPHSRLSSVIPRLETVAPDLICDRCLGKGFLSLFQTFPQCEACHGSGILCPGCHGMRFVRVPTRDGNVVERCHTCLDPAAIDRAILGVIQRNQGGVRP